MKKITTLLFCLFFANLMFCQKDENRTSLHFDPKLCISLFSPIQFGNNSLAKSHKSSIGLSLDMSILKYHNFKFNYGFAINQYKVTNHQKVGEYRFTDYIAFYPTLSYEYSVKKIIVSPTFSVGYVVLRNQKDAGDFYGIQKGIDYRIGANTEYKIKKTFAVFFGIHYIYSKFNINTSSEYIDYYGSTQQIQTSMGIKFR